MKRLFVLCRKSVSIALSGVLVAGSVFGNISVAAAATPPAAVAAASVSASSETSPTVVREIIDERTATSKTFLLSDGSSRSELFTEPVHFRDAGEWQQIDTSLEPAGTTGEVVTSSTPTPVRFAAQAPGVSPVELDGADYGVRIDMLGARENLKLVYGDRVRYLDVAPATDLEYEARADGVKETLVLDSPAAPNRFSFFVGLDGLEVVNAPGGGYQLVRPGEDQPAGELGQLFVFDSAQFGASDQERAESTMTVVPTAGGAVVTYEVSREWLDSPQRVYPVMVDPTVTIFDINSPPQPCPDTYVWAAYPNNAYSPYDNFMVGTSGGAEARSLVKFDLSSIPANTRIVSAQFKAYQYGFAAGGNSWVSVKRIVTSWPTTGLTWNTRPTFADLTSAQNGQVDTWTVADVTDVARKWVAGINPNYGLMLVQETSLPTTLRRFYSGEYGNTAYRPRLVVDYDAPEVDSVTTDRANYQPGAAATVSVHVKTLVNADVRSVRLGASGGPVQMSWTEGVGFEGTGTPEALPLASTSTVVRAADGVTFNFMCSPSQAQDLVTGTGEVRMSSTVTPAYSKTLTVPATTLHVGHATTVETTASSGWFTETSANGGKNDSASAGRGSVTLNWKPCVSATGYDVYLWDGAAYRKVDTLSGTNSTTWSTTGKKLFPSDSWIASNTASIASGTANPFASPNATLELRDDPRVLYRARTTDAFYKDLRGYYFKVVPASSGADVVANAEIVAVGLDDRTIGISDDVRSTSIDLGKTPLGAASVDASSGAFQLEATDLEISSYGPQAALTRHYSSARSGSSLLDTGWSFDFERTLAIGSTEATLTDAVGDTHRFVKSGSTWTSPVGFTGCLEPTGTVWQIRWPDGYREEYDPTKDGKLIRAVDLWGKMVEYTWNGSAPTIKAANGREIVVTEDKASRLMKAQLLTADGSRTITYTRGTTPGTTLSVQTSYGDGTPGLKVTGTYGSGGISSIRTPDATGTAGSGTWGIDYSSGSVVSTFTAPEYKAGSPAISRIEYAGSVAGGDAVVTLKQQGAQVADKDATVEQHWALNRTGTIASHTGQHTSSESPAPVTRYSYSPEGFEQSSIEPVGAYSVSIVDGRGNALRTRDERGMQTTASYDSLDRVTSETAANGAVTNYWYHATGELSAKESKLTSTTVSHAGYAYDSVGRMTSETTSLTPTTSKTTTYGYDAYGTEPVSVSTNARLSYNAAPVSVLTTASFDAFGNQTGSRDASGAITSITYDDAGRKLSESTPSGVNGSTLVTTNSRYDAFGNEIARWRSTSTTTTLVDYVTSDYDANGRRVSARTCDGAPTSVVSTATTAYDALGRTLSESDTLSGNGAKTTYDARGNALKSWSDGLAEYSDAAATVSVYDLAGNATSTVEAAANAGSVSTYAPDGRILTETSAGGATTKHFYDEAGNEVRTEASDEGTSVAVFDMGGRLVTQISDAGTDNEFATYYTYDLNGTQLSSGVKASEDASIMTESQTVTNELGWTLMSTDADGIVTTSTLDAVGRTVKESVAGSETVTTYRPDGQPSSETGPAPENRKKTLGYDDFGRQSLEVVTDGYGEKKRITTTYDGLGRISSTVDSTAKVSRTNTYATVLGGDSTQTLVYAETTSTIVVGPTGLERSRTVTYPGGQVVRSVTVRDAASRVTGWTSAFNGATAQTSAAEFDSEGRTTRLSGPSMSLETTYNPLTGRKSSDVGYVGAAESSGTYRALGATYAYGEDGRIATSTVAFGAASSPSQRTEVDAFDAAGSITTATAATAMRFTYDAEGRLATSSAGTTVTAYGWDKSHGWRTSAKAANESSVTLDYTMESRLASYRDPNKGRETTATYTYDANGQRATSTIQQGTKTTRIAWNYDGLTLLSLSATETVGASTTAVWKLSYLYDESGRPYAGTYREGTTTLATTATPFAIATTDRGDVVALADKDGKAFATYRYDAWGNPVESTTATTASIPTTSAVANIAARQVLRYAGYCWDAESKMYYCSARTYDPATRQFTSKDPAKADGEESAYQYCGGDPVGKVDPSGLWSVLFKQHFTTAAMARRFNRNQTAGDFLTWLYSSWHELLLDYAFLPAASVKVTSKTVKAAVWLKARWDFGISLRDAFAYDFPDARQHDTVIIERTSYAYRNPDAHERAQGFYHIFWTRVRLQRGTWSGGRMRYTFRDHWGSALRYASRSSSRAPIYVGAATFRAHWQEGRIG